MEYWRRCQHRPDNAGKQSALARYRLVPAANPLFRQGRTQCLQFDGASIAADVWLNGVALGQHKGAFSTIRFDVTDALKPGKNMLVAWVDNSAPLTASDPTAIAPLSGDFNMSGGLYREVSLVSTDGRAHF